jgi:hypothetical protein
MVELHRPLWSIAGSVETRILGGNGKLLGAPSGRAHRIKKPADLKPEAIAFPGQ